MVDGDRIMTLVAMTIQRLLHSAFPELAATQSALPVNIGVVQTAYANSGSTKYVQTAP